jgi:hypothetical protein
VQAAHRKSLHGKLVSDLLALGSEFVLEKVSYKAWQKLWGRSVGFRAPGTFVSTLKRRAENAGARVREVPTRETKLSQVCLCERERKKSLSERWHDCPCGVRMQRDLFSAYLAVFVQEEDPGVDRAAAAAAWSGTEPFLRAALGEVQPAREGNLPRSMGLGPCPSRSSENPGDPHSAAGMLYQRRSRNGRGRARKGMRRAGNPRP